MDTILLKSESNKISEPHRLLITLAGKANLKRSDKFVALFNRSMYYTWKNIKMSYDSKTFQLSAPTRNRKLDLLVWSYSISDIQDYFEYTLKEHERKTYNPLIRMYVNKTENKITFKTKIGSYLELPLNT